MRLLLALLLTAFFTQMLSAQDGENGLCTGCVRQVVQFQIHG